MAPASRLLIASCGLLLASTSAAAAAAAPKPSIVHVIADDLGFNDIWRYAADGTVENNPYTFTPNIERIIESGIALTAYRRSHAPPHSSAPPTHRAQG